MILKFLRWLFLKPAELPLMQDTFYGHECIFCKRDPDASYCIPKPGRKIDNLWVQPNEVAISRLDVKPGETLLVQVPQDATRAQMQRLQDTVRRSVAPGVMILVTTENVTFSVIKETA